MSIPRDIHSLWMKKNKIKLHRIAADLGCTIAGALNILIEGSDSNKLIQPIRINAITIRLRELNRLGSEFKAKEISLQNELRKLKNGG